MGTSAIAHFVDEGTPIVSIYRQSDGYLSGFGNDLQEFLAKIKIIDGISGDAALGTHANGAGCLAAQLVAYLKERVGGIYLVAPKSQDWDSDYEYTITVCSKGIFIRATSLGEVLYNGSVKGFDPVAIEKARDE